MGCRKTGLSCFFPAKLTWWRCKMGDRRQMWAWGIGVFLATLLATRATAQENIPIKFNLFDPNEPKDETPLRPRAIAILSLRNQATKLPAFPTEVDVKPLDDGFYQIDVPKNQLIEHLCD